MPLVGQFPFATVDFKTPRPDENLWLVPGLIPREGLVVLASAPKAGKTCLATAIARSVALGTPFLGKEVERGPVLWCAHEEVPDERRALHEGLTNEDPFFIAYHDFLPFIDAPDPYLDRMGNYIEKGTPTYVFDEAQKMQARLIVVDCLHAAVEKGNLADNAFARRIMGRLRRLSHRWGVAVLVLHHLTKSTGRPLGTERFADSAQILASSSCFFYMERREETVARPARSCVSATGSVASASAPEETVSRIILHGQGRHPAPPRRLELISKGVLDYELAPERESPQTKTIPILTQVSDFLAEGWELTSEEIARRLSLKPAAVRSALATLTTDGHAEKLATGERRSRYRIISSLS